MAGLTHLKEHGIFAWQRIITGLAGEIESVAVIPASPEDEVWMVIKRIVNGTPKRFIERLVDTFPATETDLATSFHLDAGVTYEGVAASSMSGLDHLDGEVVKVIEDGVEATVKTVASGSISFDGTPTKASAGIGYNSILQRLKLEVPSEGGTAQGKVKRIITVGLRFLNTFNALCGPSETDTDRIVDDFTAGELFSGDIDFDYPEGFETDGKITVIQDKPFPMTLLALMPNVEVEEI